MFQVLTWIFNLIAIPRLQKIVNYHFGIKGGSDIYAYDYYFKKYNYFKNAPISFNDRVFVLF